MNALLRMQSEADDGAAVDYFVREWMKQLRELRLRRGGLRRPLRAPHQVPRPNDGVRAWLERLLGMLLGRVWFAGQAALLLGNNPRPLADLVTCPPRLQDQRPARPRHHHQRGAVSCPRHPLCLPSAGGVGG
jgi:hypothetical protein